MYHRDPTPEIVFLIVLVAAAGGGLFLALRFLGALDRVLTRVHPDHRRMTPGHVWLNLIPVFNLVWATATVVLVAESLRAEYRARGRDRPGEDYGRTAGLALLALLATGCLIYPAVLTYPAAVPVWVVYWVRVNRFARELKSGDFRGAPAGAGEIDEGW